MRNLGAPRLGRTSPRPWRDAMDAFGRHEQGTEPAEYVLVTGLVVVPLTVAIWMLVQILFRYYGIGAGVIDLPFF